MDKGKREIITKKITVYGIVQGVGFRPLVYHIAKKYGINGLVQNSGGIVNIIAQSAKQSIDDFLSDLKHDELRSYEILDIKTDEILSGDEYVDFKIAESDHNEYMAVIPPDLPVCDECGKELYIPGNRRFHNPFVSCMACGPRYTIMKRLPYDRDTTSMADFSMCDDCLEEYVSPEDRRFHAQTISCNNCGPYLIFDNFTDEDAFESAVSKIKSGGIIAVKGIGGYHFACSPFEEKTVENLRKLKGREEKPFAVMFENMDSVREYCTLSKEEEELLKSKARPIVLLCRKDGKMAYSTNKDSMYCGVFLPYTGLQIMLTKRCGPLIMTSANISGQPIIKEDGEMLSLKSDFLDGVLYNTRRILRSLDDSVAKIVDGGAQITRRSRGYVPYPVFISGGNKDKMIFAAGSDLKAAFCLYREGSAVVSQYFGDLEERKVFELYKSSVSDLKNLLKILPDAAVCDLHPNYHSSRYARSLGLPVIYAQHHHAHIASVMAEHGLKGPVMGVAFDGTGYGDDGNIWGGEFLVCEGAEYTRYAHLKYTSVIGGDESMIDAKKTASCFLISHGLEEHINDPRLSIIQAALKNNINTVLTSSMGRLFDAAASILDIRHENRYEGQCAANLEKQAAYALKDKLEPQKLRFAIEKKDGKAEINPKPVLEAMCKLKYDSDIRSLALGFHYAAADMILEICNDIREEKNINTVALSGGVFQNTLLMERTLKVLREKNFNVFYNIKVPPNDGSISLGQTFIGLMR